MVVAKMQDKDQVLGILVQAFDENASVNYIVKQDSRRADRLRRLMAYAFQVCSKFGKVVLSEDGNACALVVYEPHGFSLLALCWDLALIMRVTGLKNVLKVLRRESLIKSRHPDEDFYYLWFIGVYPDHRGLGAGSALLLELLEEADGMNRPVYLETSTVVNIPWYKRFGFSVFDELDLGYKLSFLKRAVKVKNF